MPPGDIDARLSANCRIPGEKRDEGGRDGAEFSRPNEAPLPHAVKGGRRTSARNVALVGRKALPLFGTGVPQRVWIVPQGRALGRIGLVAPDIYIRIEEFDGERHGARLSHRGKTAPPARISENELLHAEDDRGQGKPVPLRPLGRLLWPFKNRKLFVIRSSEWTLLSGIKGCICAMSRTEKGE